MSEQTKQEPKLSNNNTGKQFGRIKPFIVVPILILLLTVTSVIASAFQLLTLFRFRNICCRYIIRPCSLLILRLYGITHALHGSENIPEGQKVFIINHSSTIDVALLTALCFSDTRYFLSKATYRYLPVTLINLCIGTFYIDRQDKPARRTRTFQNAERILRKTGDSVLLSVEGNIITSGEIAPFNKGAFHLATNLRTPLVPVYIHIPHAINPGVGYKALPGNVDVHILPPVATNTWIPDELEINKMNIRNMFVAVHQRMHQSD